MKTFESIKTTFLRVKLRNFKAQLIFNIINWVKRQPQRRFH